MIEMNHCLLTKYPAKALDVALGLQYLHDLTPSIVHGDLKGVSVSSLSTAHTQVSFIVERARHGQSKGLSCRFWPGGCEESQNHVQ